MCGIGHPPDGVKTLVVVKLVEDNCWDPDGWGEERVSSEVRPGLPEVNGMEEANDNWHWNEAKRMLRGS